MTTGPQSKDALGNLFFPGGKVEAPAVAGSPPTFIGKTISYGTAGADWTIGSMPPPPIIAGWSLLKSIPANPDRTGITGQNLSPNIIQVVVSDGVGGVPTSTLVAPGSPQKQSDGTLLYIGGTVRSLIDKGRVDIWGPAGSLFPIREY